MVDPTTRVLPMAGLKVPVIEAEGGARLYLPSLAELPLRLDEEAVFLGLHQVGPHTQAPLFAQVVPEAEAGWGRFVELRSVGPLLTAAEAGLGAYARALAHWRTRHLFCGACGTATVPIEAGHCRRCPSCSLDVFPRTDPAVIVLVTKGERCVLGRSLRFAVKQMYSTLAGFVEVGESLESALRREIWEEVGIELGTISYRSSQPWPFPQSLMLGFRAEAVTETLNIELDELEDARWFTRAELKDPATRPVQLPNIDSIARFLIEEWLAEG